MNNYLCIWFREIGWTNLLLVNVLTECALLETFSSINECFTIKCYGILKSGLPGSDEPHFRQIIGMSDRNL
jgi:hypothetical protein